MKAIYSGAVPYLEDVVSTLAHCEDASEVQKAAHFYSEQIAPGTCSSPTDAFLELLEEHTACEKEAILVFMECSFKDERKFQKELVALYLILDLPPDEYSLEVSLLNSFLFHILR